VLRLVAAKLDLAVATFALTRTVLNILEIYLFGLPRVREDGILRNVVQKFFGQAELPSIAASQ